MPAIIQNDTKLISKPRTLESEGSDTSNLAQLEVTAGPLRGAMIHKQACENPFCTYCDVNIKRPL